MSGVDAYRAAFEAAEDALLLLQGDRIISSNKSAGRLLVGSEGPLSGRSLSGLSPRLQPDGQSSSDGLQRRTSSAIAGVPQRFRWTFLRPGGGVTSLAVRLVRLDVATEAGPLIQVLLRDEDKDQRRLHALAIDMLGVAGLDGRFKELSPSWERTLGFTREELMSRPYLEFIHPEDRQRTLTETESFSTGARTLTFENRYLCKDGSYRWLEWNAMLALDEGLVYFVARDVTQRRLDEQALRASEEKLRSLFEAIPQRVVVLDKDARLLAVNRAPAGMKVEAMLGRSIYDLASPEERDVVTQALRAVLEKGEPTQYEIATRDPSGAVAWHHVRVNPLGSNGAATGALLVSEDITGRKLLEERLRQSVERLEAYAQELEGKNQMLADEIAERERTASMLLRQQEAIRALSTPIIQAWDGVLALPIIGVVDSVRAAQIMEKLLAEIVRTKASFAVLDLTGVEGVDGPTVDHLLQVARAASLLGSRCLISGISPEVARAMVELGSDATDIDTFGELQDALRHALAGARAPATRRRLT